MRIQYLIPLLPSIVGVILALVAYFAPFGNTGVAGSIGALLGLVGAAATMLGIAVAMRPTLGRRGWIALHILVMIAAALTAIAAFFLMQFAFAIAMVVALLGVALAFYFTRNHVRSAQ